MEKEYIVKKYPNGLRALLMPRGSAHKVLINAFVLAGSRSDPHGREGLAHFTEHMIMQGTKGYPSKLDLYAAVKALGGRMNAGTSLEQADYWVQLSPEDLEVGLRIIMELLRLPVFLKESFERTRSIIKREIDLYYASPFNVARAGALALLYPSDNLGRIPIGSKKSLSLLALEDVVSFHKRAFTPENTVLAFGGKFDVGSIDQKIKHYFADWRKTGQKHELPLESPKLITREQERIVRGGFSQAVLTIAFPTFSYHETKKMAALRLLKVALTGGVNPRLYNKVREELRLTYHVDCVSRHASNTGYLFIETGIPHKSVSKVRKAIWEELEQLKAFPPERHELNGAKRIIYANQQFAKDNPLSNVEDYALQVLKHDWYIVTNEEQLGHIMAVRPENIQKLAQEIFTPEQARTVVLTKD